MGSIVEKDVLCSVCMGNGMEHFIFSSWNVMKFFVLAGKGSSMFQLVEDIG